MTANFAIYDETTGQIVRWGYCQDTLTAAQVREDETGVASLETEEFPVPKDHYVLNGELTLRPRLPAPSKTTIIADGIDAAIISPIPNCIAQFYPVDPNALPPLSDGSPIGPVTEIEVLDGSLEIKAVDAGTYRVKILAFPYLDYIVRIVAI